MFFNIRRFVMVKILIRMVVLALLLVMPTVQAMNPVRTDLTHAQPTSFVINLDQEDEVAGGWYAGPPAQVAAAAQVLPTEVPEPAPVLAVSALLERRGYAKPVQQVNIQAADAVAGHRMYVRNTPDRFVRPEPGAFNVRVVAAAIKKEYAFCPPQYMLENGLKAHFGQKYVKE